MRAVLESGGHEVHEAADGLAGIENYFLVKPAVVFLDLLMKELGGYETLTRLRQMDPSALVVVASADIQSSTRTMVNAAGAFRFIGKPFVPAEVLGAVSAALETHGT